MFSSSSIQVVLCMLSHLFFAQVRKPHYTKRKNLHVASIIKITMKCCNLTASI